MARTQEIVTAMPGIWGELTSGDALSGGKFQALDGEIAVRRGGDTPPGIDDVGWRYDVGQGERVADLSEISSAVGNRLWGMALGSAPVKVLVDHA